jgi:alpha-L-fucosidase
MNLFKAISIAAILTVGLPGRQAGAQPNVHGQSATYQWPDDPAVKEKLGKWQDQKFGMIIHWGVYAVPGMIESWALCSEDWIDRDSSMTYSEFKDWYWGLSKKFNPVNFNPEQWAKAGKDAGMRYMVFTTKHHDGFNMFDTKQTDYSIAKGPFKDHPRADVAKYVFEAFRKQDFMIGAYFSKPDWHSENFWWPKYATPNRNVNYDIRKHPERWERFRQFTYNQISELMHNYGSVDILWLDGGWVRPKETVNAEVLSWGAPIPEFSQEVNMPAIAAMARKAQPGILMVDRTVHGPYENYQTPEQRIPEKQLPYPWESCMTLGGAWGFVPNDRYKSAAKVIHSLIEVTAKGGSLLLGIGPKADGTLPQEVIDRLEEIGQWTSVNGKAIYSTRPANHYQSGNTWFTQSKDGHTQYALVCLEEGKTVPSFVEWQGNIPAKGAKVTLVSSGKKVRWQATGNKVKVWLPAGVNNYSPALAFAITK